MQSRLVASATAPEMTSADDDDNPPDGDGGVVSGRTADQLDAIILDPLFGRGELISLSSPGGLTGCVDGGN